MVDFGALTPEVNSARMYAGPGSSSLQAAASAWNGLAAELQSAAQGYETVITQLSSDEWTGAGVGVDGQRRAAVRVVDEHHRRAGRAGRDPGQGGRRGA